MGKKGWTWQQDNSPVHRAQIVRDGFFEESVATTEWPAYSPDLNLIENVWSALQAKVYESGQFTNKKDLLAEIKRCAKWIDPSIIKNLYASMNKRLVAVLEAKGGQID
jgi:transposase